MPLQTLLTGHGAPVKRHKDLIRRRLVEHNRRSERIAAVLEAGPKTAYCVAHELWPARMVREQPLLVLWEVLGHLDLLSRRASSTSSGPPTGIHASHYTTSPREMAGKPLWLRAVYKVERAVGTRVEAAVRSDTYFDLVAESQRRQKQVRALAEGLSRRCLHLVNLPAGSDVRRLREQLGRMDRRLHSIQKELAELEAVERDGQV